MVVAVTFAELAAFAGRNPVLSLALVGLTVAVIVNEILALLSGVRRIGPVSYTHLDVYKRQRLPQANVAAGFG